MKSNSIGHENNLKGWISTRGGIYASSSNSDPYISCTTFNILAPIYKRLDKEVGEFRYCALFFVIFFDNGVLRT